MRIVAKIDKLMVWLIVQITKLVMIFCLANPLPPPLGPKRGLTYYNLEQASKQDSTKTDLDGSEQ